MVGYGATSHIITEKRRFTEFDLSFDPKKHYMELADGSRENNVALKCGDTEVYLQDSNRKVCRNHSMGCSVHTNLSAGYILPPADDVKLFFKKGQNELTSRDGAVFRIEKD